MTRHKQTQTNTTSQEGGGGNHPEQTKPEHTTPHRGGKQPTTTPHHRGGTIGGGKGGGGGGEIVPTTTGSPILQPEALYCNQKLDPTTTEQLFTQKGSLLQLEPSILFGVRLCRQYSVVKGCVGALYSVFRVEGLGVKVSTGATTIINFRYSFNQFW